VHEEPRHNKSPEFPGDLNTTGNPVESAAGGGGIERASEIENCAFPTSLKVGEERCDGMGWDGWSSAAETAEEEWSLRRQWKKVPVPVHHVSHVLSSGILKKVASIFLPNSISTSVRFPFHSSGARALRQHVSRYQALPHVACSAHPAHQPHPERSQHQGPTTINPRICDRLRAHQAPCQRRHHRSRRSRKGRRLFASSLWSSAFEEGVLCDRH
jgi:hypothetical protein